jgi:hypothetical protein
MPDGNVRILIGKEGEQIALPEFNIDGNLLGNDGDIVGESKQLIASRDVTSFDYGDMVINNTASNFTLTIRAGMVANFGFAALQAAGGTITITGELGVTINGINGSSVTTQGGSAIAPTSLSVIYIANNTYAVI